MTLWPRSLSLRLALMFALASVLLLGVIGFYLYQSLQREVAWRDDQALLGRLQRMHALIDDSDSIERCAASRISTRTCWAIVTTCCGSSMPAASC